MQIGDTPKSYGWLSIVLHWIVAALVVTLWLLGERVGDQPTRELRGEALMLHISVGILAWSFLVGFIIWRLTQKSPEAAEQHWALKLLAKAVQGLLLLAIAVQVVTGPFAFWLMGRPLSPFGWFKIPSPVPANHDLHELLGDIHGTTATVILVLVGLHTLGALKHLIIDRDGVFQRMLGIRRAGD